MLEDFQIRGLTKILNSKLLKSIYPMVDRIEVKSLGSDINPLKRRSESYYSVDIYLNDPDITKSNMYEMGFDPHYLVGHHLLKFLNYMGGKSLEGTFYFNLFNPDGELIDSELE